MLLLQLPGLASCMAGSADWNRNTVQITSAPQVPARRPGLLLVFRDTAVAEAAVAAIRAGRPRILGPPMPGGPPPGGRAGPPPGPGSAADSGSPAPRRGSPGPRRGERERDRGRHTGRERERERQRGGDERERGEGQGAPLPPPEFASRTLWVGQVRSTAAMAVCNLRRCRHAATFLCKYRMAETPAAAARSSAVRLLLPDCSLQHTAR